LAGYRRGKIGLGRVGWVQERKGCVGKVGKVQERERCVRESWLGLGEERLKTNQLKINHVREIQNMSYVSHIMK
jgi:hypothetical protein